MKKNHQIHLFLDKELKETLEREASQRNVSLSELCRQKLKECSQLTRIELLLETLSKKRMDLALPKAAKSVISKW